MLQRILAAVCLACCAATLAAQSTVSYEIATDPNQIESSNGSQPDIVAGDFNNDGKPDLIQCCNNNGLVFRAGHGDGTFAAPVTAAPQVTGNYSQGVLDLIAVDVNGDGKLDLVGIPSAYSPRNGTSANGFAVWIGNGNGTFQAPVTYSATNTTYSPGQDLAVGNFFGDGHPDVAIGENGGLIQVYRNQGNGTYVADKSITIGSTSGQVFMLTAGDLNGTGVSDLAAVTTNGGNSFEGPAYVIWNDGKGDFTPDVVETYSAAESMSIGRVNGDARMDLVLAYSNASGSNFYDSSVDIYYGQGNDKLDKKTAVSQAPVQIYQVNAADINGDGYGDIVAVGDGPCSPSPDVCAGWYVFPGHSDGSFEQTPQSFSMGNSSNEGYFTLGDFNRDGMMDAAVETSLSEEAEILVNATNRGACGTYVISPTVTVCAPVDNTYSPSPVPVDANSYDTTPVTAMQQYIDGTLVYNKPVTSIDATFKVDDGSHLFVTKAWDKSGRSFDAARNVIAYSGTPGPVCPAAADAAVICLPPAPTSSSPVLILANGDAGKATAKAAQLYIDGKLVVDKTCDYTQQGGCTVTNTSVYTSQALSGGSHQLVFKLWTTDNHVYEAQHTVTVN